MNPKSDSYTDDIRASNMNPGGSFQDPDPSFYFLAVFIHICYKNIYDSDDWDARCNQRKDEEHATGFIRNPRASKQTADANKR